MADGSEERAGAEGKARTKRRYVAFQVVLDELILPVGIQLGTRLANL